MVVFFLAGAFLAAFFVAFLAVFFAAFLADFLADFFAGAFFAVFFALATVRPPKGKDVTSQLNQSHPSRTVERYSST